MPPTDDTDHADDPGGPTPDAAEDPRALADDGMAPLIDNTGADADADADADASSG